LQSQGTDGINTALLSICTDFNVEFQAIAWAHLHR